ncbi:MAG: transglutaminase domain-containing protein [Chloroflexota bacterium]
MDFARRILFSRTGLQLALLLLAIGCIAYGLAESPRIHSAIEAPALFVSAAAGTFLGWRLAASRLPGWAALPIGTLAGMVWTICQGGKLAPHLLNWIGKAPALLPQVLRWHETPPDWQPISLAGQLLFEESGRVGQRLFQWGTGFVQRAPVNDPLALAVFWLFVLWLLAAWAGWAIRRRRNPLLATVPGIGLLAATLNYQGLDHHTLVAAVGIAMLLMALARYHQHEERWEQHRVDYAEDIRIDLAVAAGALVCALLAVGLFVPVLSIRTVTEFIHRWAYPANPPVEEALGLQARPQPTAQGSVRPAGLQRTHQLGGGPTLTQNIVLQIEVIEPAYAPLPYESLAESADAPRYYWRIITYDHYNGSGWQSSATNDASYVPDQPIFDTLPAYHKVVRQKVNAVQPLGGALVVTGFLQSADQPYRVSWRAAPGDFYTADALGVLVADGPYEAISLLPNVGAVQLRAAPQDYPNRILQNYLQLPDELPFRVRELAVSITANADTAYDTAMAIESFLRKIPYSLEVSAPPHGRDVVDYFLFDLQTGFCDYYATSMVVLARAAGLPARMVIGYAPGSYDPYRRQYVVLEDDYHAWVEVFFNGIGWVAFEPTAIQPTIPRDEDVQAALPDSALPTPPQQAAEKLATRLKAYATLALVSLLCLCALSVQGVFLARILETWWWSRKPPHEAIFAVYRRMRRSGQHLAGPGLEGATPSEFAVRLQASLWAVGMHLPGRTRVEKYLAQANDAVAQLTRLYIHAAYSEHPVASDEGTRALGLWRTLRGRLWLAESLRGKKSNGKTTAEATSPQHFTG